MIKQRYSKSGSTVKFPPEFKKSENTEALEWLKIAYDDLQHDLNKKVKWSYILLLGSMSIEAFRIRVAQSHLRADMLPSYWSDCGFLLIDGNQFDNPTFFHLPLLQPSNNAYAPMRNGLIELKLNDLLKDSWKIFPNIALLAIPVAQDDIVEALKKFRESHIAYDAVENIIPWLAYVWGVGDAANPLRQQIGLPSAMLLNQLYGSCNFDLSPNVNNNLSTPEVFWSAVKYWCDFYQNTTKNNEALKVRYIVEHKYSIDEGPKISSVLCPLKASSESNLTISNNILPRDLDPV
ncbi:MAG TPA: hypothetical protein PKY67_05390 [Nitrosomonas sp.]|nr:hypothetical protein [Nitrosomonas sp.]